MVFLYRPFFVLALFCISFWAQASYNFSPELTKAYHQIFQLKTKSARQLIKSSLTKDPKNGIAIYLNNYVDVAECIVTGEEYRYELLKKKYEKRIDVLEKLNKKDPYHLFTISEVKLHMAFAKIYFEERVNAFWTLRQAYKLTKQNLKQHPKFLPSKKTLGLLEVLIGSVPDEHKWLMNSVGFNGSHTNGMYLLKEAESDTSPVKEEATLISIMTDFYILQNSPLDQIKTVAVKYRKDPDNLLLGFIYGSMLTKIGRNDQSLNILKRLPDANDYIRFYYLSSMIGDCYFFKGEYKHAITYYQYYLNHSKSNHYLKSAHVKLSLAHWLLEDYDKAEIHRLKAIKEGSAYFDSDKSALKMAKQNKALNKILLKARILYDGGYYNKALKLLNTHDVSEFDKRSEKIEYFYRKGRIYQKIAFTEKAIRHYVSVINNAKPGDQLYYTPNACLQLGYIFKKKEEIEKAKKYFKKAISYKGHEYKNSIDSKAKTALSQLN